MLQQQRTPSVAAGQKPAAAGASLAVVSGACGRKVAPVGGDKASKTARQQRVFIDFQVREAVERLVGMGVVREAAAAFESGCQEEDGTTPAVGVGTACLRLQAMGLNDALAAAAAAITGTPRSAAGNDTDADPWHCPAYWSGTAAGTLQQQSGGLAYPFIAAAPADDECYFSPVASAKRAAAELAAARLGQAAAGSSGEAAAPHQLIMPAVVKLSGWGEERSQWLHAPHFTKLNGKRQDAMLPRNVS